MSKMINDWEFPVSSMIPYLQWNELSEGPIDSWRIGRHNHATYELHIIVSGSCSLFVDNAELYLQAGQGILISPEIYHAPNSVMQPFGRISAAFFPGEQLLKQQVLPHLGEYRVFAVDDAIRELCASICQEAKQTGSLFHKELLANQLSQLMLRVLRIIKETSTSPQQAASYPKQVEDMTVIDRFFVNTPPKLRTKENLAKLLHCSPRQVLRKIYTLYGMSFQEKQTLSRIDTAQHLLSTTDKAVDEICNCVGYADRAAFYKAFKRFTDTTPIKYRKAQRKKS